MCVSVLLCVCMSLFRCVCVCVHMFVCVSVLYMCLCGCVSVRVRSCVSMFRPIFDRGKNKYKFSVALIQLDLGGSRIGVLCGAPDGDRGREV